LGTGFAYIHVYYLGKTQKFRSFHGLCTLDNHKGFAKTHSLLANPLKGVVGGRGEKAGYMHVLPLFLLSLRSCHTKY
jgi:hypothetical protein